MSKNDAERWFFSKEKIKSTPSRREGIDVAKELFYRQQAATLIQDMGQKLLVSQLCINSAIVYMHRFYMFHSFAKFHRNLMAPCCLFLACKVEEQPRKLELLLKVGWSCMNREAPPLDVKSSQFRHLYDELVRNENILLATLGFDCSIDHPHTHVVRCCHLIKASRDLAQTSYFMATNSLHLTMMCLEYRSTLVACVCIYLVYKWSGHEIPRSSEGRDWFWYVDREVTLDQLERVSEEFLLIFNQCPSKLKKKIMSSSKAISDQEAERRHRSEGSQRPRPVAPSSSGDAAAIAAASGDAPALPPAAVAAPSGPASVPASRSSQQQQSSSAAAARIGPAAVRAHRERKEREQQAVASRERRGMGPDRDWRPGAGDSSSTAHQPPPDARVPPIPSAGHSASSAGRPQPAPLTTNRAPSVGDVRQLLRDVDGRHSLLQQQPPPPADKSRRPAPVSLTPDMVRSMASSKSTPIANNNARSNSSANSAPVKPSANGPSSGSTPSTNSTRREQQPSSRSSSSRPSVPRPPSSSARPAPITTHPPSARAPTAGPTPSKPPSAAPHRPAKLEPLASMKLEMPMAMGPLISPLHSPPVDIPDVLADPPKAPVRDVKPPASLSLDVDPSRPVANSNSARASGSIFSPPAIGNSAPELVLNKVDDIPMFSPLKSGSSSIRLNSTGDSTVMTAGAASTPSTAVVTATHAPALSLAADTAAPDHRHKHREKKKKKKEHKEHKPKKEKKKHKDKDKEHKKSKHRDKDEGLSKLKIKISRERLGGSSDPVAEGDAVGKQEVPEPVSFGSPSSGLKIRIGKDKLIQMSSDSAETSEQQHHHAKKRSRDSTDADGAHHHTSKHKAKHKRQRQDSEMSDSLQF